MEANLRPIPPPHDEDDEDVHWALSTATALWARGEREEALRWLRRAAEQASDANADLRALELFKAAAEVAQKISATDADPGSATATDSPPAVASAPPKTPVSAPPQAPGAAPSTASAPPPRPGASGAGSRPTPSRPPGADAGRAERGSAGTSSPPAAAPAGAQRSPSVRAPAGDATPGPVTSAMASSRDAGPPRPVGGPGRAVPLAPGRAPAPARSVAVREVTPTQLSPAARMAGSAPGLPARPAAGSQAAGAAGRAGPAKARPIASFAGSTHTRVSSTTAVTEEVPVVKLPAAGQEPGQGASGAAPQSATGEQLPADGEPPPDQRETVPTAIAVVSGRRASPLGAGSSQEATERRPRLWPDDEGTTRRPLTAQEQRVLMEHRIEDLDEETPMLGLEQEGDGDSEPSAAAPTDASAGAGPEDRADWTEAEPDDDDAGVASADQQGEMTLAEKPSGAMQARPSEGAAVDSAWSDPPYEGEWQAPPPRLPASQIEPLPALRIAVIGISSTGELRLVPMDGRNAPPRGAALGILVPLSPGDGETIARLLQLRG
ncbi:hypothetical protein [Sorangium sp. So ce1078]|uniref:hypothetical protein n=1 Tax=Sorangium sp. So ce1078 TaxID=3133329 RepID=UPI003F63A32F